MPPNGDQAELCDPDEPPAKRARHLADTPASGSFAIAKATQPRSLAVRSQPAADTGRPVPTSQLLDKEAIIEQLDKDQFAGMGPGCYRLKTREQLWIEYLGSSGRFEELEPSTANLQPRQVSQRPSAPVIEVSDSQTSDSISISLQCEFCKGTTDDTSMLVCDSCNKGYHTYCLCPALYAIPGGAWFCGDCGGETQTSPGSIDITEDQHVLQYLIEGGPLDWSQTEKKRVAKRAKNYQYNDTGTLMRKPVHSPLKSYPARPVPAKHERDDIIASTHDLGHFGVMRTTAMIAERFYWGGIVEDCRQYIRSCVPCKLQNAKFSEPQTMQSIPICDQSFHRVGIDLVGPLQTSAFGNKYIIVCMDYLTKWCEVAAVPDKTAQTVADFFFENVIARHGCPKEVLSDNGSEFKGEFGQLLQACHIDHRHTSPNHPAANGLVEHFNGTLVTALRKIVSHNPSTWDKAIPTVLLGYRASLQVSTKFSPFFMLYARQPLLPMQLAANPVSIEELSPEDASLVVLNKATVIQDTAQLALGNINKAQAKQQRDYKAKRKYVEPSSLQPGDFVVLKPPARKSKLMPAADPVILKLEDWGNQEKTMAIVCDASDVPKRWKENVCNLARFDSSGPSRAAHAQ